MPAHRVAEPDFKERVEESFGRQAAMKLIGAELTRCEPGIVEVEMPFRDELTQQHGILHAGIISAALDSACGYAALSLMPTDAAVLTIEFKVNLLAPVEVTVFCSVVKLPNPDGRLWSVMDKLSL